MSTAQNCEVKCPSCEKHQGVYEADTRTGEEWFACLDCGWGFETKLRRFGVQSLSDLRALLDIEPKPGQKRTPVWSLALDSLLAEIVEDCVKNGFRGDEDPLKTLNSIFNRPSAERTSSDWQFLVNESTFYSYCVLDENGKRVYDHVEKAPKIGAILEFPPFEELREKPEWRQESSKVAGEVDAWRKTIEAYTTLAECNAGLAAILQLQSGIIHPQAKRLLMDRTKKLGFEYSAQAKAFVEKAWPSGNPAPEVFKGIITASNL